MVKRGIISRREVVEIREGQTVGFGGAGNTLVLNLDCGCKIICSIYYLHCLASLPKPDLSVLMV